MNALSNKLRSLTRLAMRAFSRYVRYDITATQTKEKRFKVKQTFPL